MLLSLLQGENVKKTGIFGIFLTVMALLLTTSLVKSQTDRSSVHLILGNPSEATQDASNADNFLMLKPQYALSYNWTSPV